MKKLGLLIAALGFSIGASANEVASNVSHLTLAAAETGSTVAWSIEKAETAFEARFEKTLEESAEALNEKISASLEKSLEEKFRNNVNLK